MPLAERGAWSFLGSATSSAAKPIGDGLNVALARGRSWHTPVGHTSQTLSIRYIGSSLPRSAPDLEVASQQYLALTMSARTTHILLKYWPSMSAVEDNCVGTADHLCSTCCKFRGQFGLVVVVTHPAHRLARFLSGPSSSPSLVSAYCVTGCVSFQALVNMGSFLATSAYFSNASRGSS